MNYLEKKLTGWKPRGPSPRLERKLFGGEPKGNFLGHWMAPAMACVLAIGMITSGEALRQSLPSGPRNLNLLALTNETLSLFSINTDNLQWNICLTAGINLDRPQKLPAILKPVLNQSTNHSIL